jgi:phage terminase small subunit
MTNPARCTARQLKFFELKCQGYTNVKAAIEAGYSKKCPRRVADNIVSYKWYQDLMKKHADKIEKKIEINSEKIITELSHSAFFDPINIFDVETGAVKPIDQIPEETRRAISSIDVQETFEMKDGNKEWTGYIKKIKFWDKPRCNELIGKNIGMFADKLKVDVSTPELTEALGKLLGATIK